MGVRSPIEAYIKPKRKACGFYEALHRWIPRFWCLTDLDCSLLYYLVLLLLRWPLSNLGITLGGVNSVLSFADEAMPGREEPNRLG